MMFPFFLYIQQKNPKNLPLVICEHFMTFSNE